MKSPFIEFSVDRKNILININEIVSVKEYEYHCTVITTSDKKSYYVNSTYHDVIDAIKKHYQ